MRLHTPPKKIDTSIKENLKKVNQILEKNSFRKGMTEERFKFASHPVYSERFDIIENLSKKKVYDFCLKLKK